MSRSVRIDVVDWSRATCEAILCQDVATLVDLKGREVQSRANKNLTYDDSAGYEFETATEYWWRSNRHVAYVTTGDSLSETGEIKHKALSKGLWRDGRLTK